MTAESHEQAFRNLEAQNALYMGDNYIVDHDTGLVSNAVVWATGGIWFIDHWDKSHPCWEREYTTAIKRRETLHRARGVN
jgi:hypothetical protein